MAFPLAYIDGTETTTTGNPTPNGLFTPASAIEEDAPIKAWLEISAAAKSNDTHDPIPGDTLVIVDKTYGRVLACHPGGRVMFDNIDEYDMNQAIPKRWKWLCTESEDLIGFKSLAGDRFLGHNFWWNFEAHATMQRGWEHFVLKKHQAGYRMQCLFFWNSIPLAARSDGTGIGATKSLDAFWGFVLVRD